MNNVNMANMAQMGGPVGPPMQMMNSGAGVGGPVAPGKAPSDNRTLLNTYIYEYFLRHHMYDCARALLNSDQPVNVKDGSNRRRDENGADGDGEDSKEDMDSKRPDDLPAPKVPTPLPESCFLYEWFSLFWDMFNAQRGKATGVQVNTYVAHTQQQSRMRQSQQQDMLRNMRPEGNLPQQQQFMMRGMPNGAMNMNMKGANLARTAMANNQNPNMMLQRGQNQMQRDPSDNQRPSSPSSGDNAPSPSKKPRLEGTAPFNPHAPGMMANGRPPQGLPGQQMGGPGVNVAQQMLITNGIDPTNLSQQQLQAFQRATPGMQAKSIATYSQNLTQQQMAQMPGKQMQNPGGPQGQGSPMMGQQENPGAVLGSFYNPPGEIGPGGMRQGPGGTGPTAGGSNHALQDYQMQLMLLEQQNKKRLMMARQEQDSLQGGPARPDGQALPGGPGAPAGPNGQQFQDTSPQGARTGASPNPTDMKRGTPQMNNPGVPSPHPEGGQSRGSPNPVGLMQGNMDPNMAPHYFKGMNNMDGNMVAGGQMNAGMRPPSSHPGQQFNGQMNAQQMMAGRGQQQLNGQGGPQGGQWQGGPNGNAMGGQAPQGQVQGTPQQRPMPPPSAPAAAANAKTTTASPQPSNAAPPTPQQAKGALKKKDTKAAKTKTATTKKSNSSLNTAGGAGEAAQEPEPPTPATPITPVNAASFNKNAQATAVPPPPVPNGQAPAVPPAQQAPAAQPADSMGNGGFNMNDPMEFSMEFANPLTSGDVLDSFDFDSFLHDGDGGDGGFDFNAPNFMEGSGETIGAE